MRGLPGFLVGAGSPRIPGARAALRLAALAGVAAVTGLAAGLASAAVHCEIVGQAPDDESLVLDVLSHDQGQVHGPGCALQIPMWGTVAVDVRSHALYDFYLVIDRSGSTNSSSGVDVDGDGMIGGPPDSIFHAEMLAARRFVEGLDPEFCRVAVITFSSAQLEHELSGDLASVLATLAVVDARGANGGTDFEDALQGMVREVLARGGRPYRHQIGIFISDGQDNAGQVAAEELAGLGVVVDTFGLGSRSGTGKLLEIASITGGRFFDLQTAGDIIEVLPELEFEPLWELGLQNLSSDTQGTVFADADAGTFDALIDLVPGRNVLMFSIEVEGLGALTLDCFVELFLVAPPAGLIGNELRAWKLSPDAMLLEWPGASPLALTERDTVLMSPGPTELFVPGSPRLASPSWLLDMPQDELTCFDVRRINCAGEMSAD